MNTSVIKRPTFRTPTAVFQPNAPLHNLQFYQKYTDYTKHVGNTQAGQFLPKEFPFRISKPDKSESISEIYVRKG
jgi:hypothetical protein